MLALLQQYWPGIAAGALMAVAMFAPKDLGAKLKAWLPVMKPGVPAAPAPSVIASKETDPATLCEQAASIWRIAGKCDLSTKASALAVESAAQKLAEKGGGA